MKKMEDFSDTKHPEILDTPANKLKIENCLEFCCDKDNCLSLDDILRSFNAPLSEEQAWSLIYQSVLLYRNFIRIEFIDKNTKKDSKTQKVSHRIKVPKSPKNLNIHKDGTVHINDKSKSSLFPYFSFTCAFFSIGFSCRSAIKYNNKSRVVKKIDIRKYT